MKRVFAACVAIAVIAGMAVAVPTTAAAASAAVLEGFNTSPASTWVTTLGNPAVGGPAGGVTEGSTALKLGYNFASNNAAEIGYRVNPTPYTGAAPTSIAIDIRGDGSYNTLYVRLMDATGESFFYRVDNINVPTWKTVTIPLSQTPASVTGGDGNKVLDLPLVLDRINVTRNGSQAATGWVEIDNLRLQSDDWTAVQADRSTFWANGGESTNLAFTAGTAGDYSLTLADLSGHTRVLTGQVPAGPVALTWDGRTSGGTVFAGNVSAVLSYDSTPNGAVTAPNTVGTPYLVGVTAFAKGTVGSAVGVNSFLTTLDTAAAVDADAALMENAHVRYAREEFEWNRIEPRQGFFDWTKFDRAVKLAAGRGIELVGKLVYSAVWASSAPAGTAPSAAEYYPPTSTATYAEYARRVVERYKSSVHVWEIWNEPNHPNFWKPAPSATQYGNLLKAAYPAIKSADPNSTVLGGSLAGWDDAYMAGVHAAGAASSYDGLAIHTYVAGAPEASPMSQWIDGAQAFLDRTGNGSKKVWITELGWSTCTDGCTNAVNEAQQSSYLERAYIDAVARGVRGVMWFSLREFGNTANRNDNYGLVETGGRKKPAYDALARIGAALDDSVAIGSVAPTADGLFYTVDDMATGSYPVSMIGGGSASIAASTSKHGGAGSQKLTYAFTGASTGLEVTVNKPASGQPKAISVWVYGDGSNTPVWMRLQDASGETFQAKVGQAGKVAWRRLTFYLDGGNPSYSHWGGNNDGVVNYPITVKSLLFYRPPAVQFGTIYVDDVTAHYGQITRGVVSIGHQANIQTVYSLGAQTIALPVDGAEASLMVSGAPQPMTVSGGKVLVNTSPNFSATVLSTAGLTAPPALVGVPTEFHWRGGDRGVYTVQVYAASGALVRTLTANEGYDAGRRAATWKGNLLDGSTAPAGDYLFRLTLFANDGRKVTLDTPFTVQE